MSYTRLHHTQRRVAQIEEIVDQLMRELRLEHSDASALIEVRQLICAGDTAQAIKQYRAHTGITLREARRTIEAVAREMDR